MKLNTNHTNIERAGVQSESTFTIKTNALSFNILSSGLYTDPIMAIVRELSCNAYDAHVSAGTANTPFEIHLPNDLEPFLSIKDYGIGLSDENIQGAMVPAMRENDNGVMVEVRDADGEIVLNRTGGLYTTYFDSTKTDSNDYIGALGLGSKSPFSYSDAFEVISRYNGKKRTYAIFLNEEGIPSVALMGVIDTDEHSGLEVKLAIKQEDFYTFKARTATALQYFPIKPKVTGSLNFTFDEIAEQIIETDKWMLAPGGSYSNSITAVQGNVAYRVDTSQVSDALDSILRDFMNKSNIVVFFNIGELEVSANREEIRYDKNTIAAIVERIKKINVEFTPEVEKKIGKVNTKYWYACIELNDLSLSLFRSSATLRALLQVDEVKNKNLKRYIESNGMVQYDGVVGYDITRYTLSGYYAKAHRLKRSHVTNTILPEAGTLVVINDVKTGGLKRLGNYINEHNTYRDTIVITKRVEPHVVYDVLNKPKKYKGYVREMKSLVKELGKPDIFNISEITDALPKRVTNRELSFYRYTGMTSTGYYSEDKISWDQTTCKLDDGGLYFPLKYASSPSIIRDDILIPLGFGDNDTKLALLFLINEYNTENGTEHTIYSIRGLPTAAFNKAKKLDNWVNLFEFAKDHLPKYMDMMEFHRSKQLTSVVLNIKNVINSTEFIDNVKKLDDNSTFKSVVASLIEGEKKYSHKVLKDVDMILRLHQRTHNDEKVTGTAFYDADAFIEYPMLTVVESLSYNTKWSTLFDYIKLIDRSK